MASRSLDDLAPCVKRGALDLLAAADAAGLDLLVYCTLRSNDEQAKLWALGRSVPGSIVTNARPGTSLHNPDKNGQSWAFDVVPLVAGKACWGDAAALRKMGELGEAAGLEWAGRWAGRLRESVHFQASAAMFKNR